MDTSCRFDVLSEADLVDVAANSIGIEEVNDGLSNTFGCFMAQTDECGGHDNISKKKGSRRLCKRGVEQHTLEGEREGELMAIVMNLRNLAVGWGADDRVTPNAALLEGLVHSVQQAVASFGCSMQSMPSIAVPARLACHRIQVPSGEKCGPGLWPGSRI